MSVQLGGVEGSATLMDDWRRFSGRSMLRPYGIELRQGTTAFVESVLRGTAEIKKALRLRSG